MASGSQTHLRSPKTALVLSSGGLFGAYHVGAWQFLTESGFRPDVVIGASVGALNGWAIAAGCSPTDLAQMWLDEGRSNVLKRRQTQRWRDGFFDRKPLRDLVSDIYSSYKASSNFGLVIVELPTLRSHLVRGDSATASHLLATASIPIVMPFVSIDGKTFTDGGLLEDVPLWAAAEMGATRIIAIDAMHFESPWWYKVGVCPMGLFAPRLPIGVRTQTTIIRPSRSLGHFTTAVEWDRDRIRQWIELGYADASRAMNHTATEPAPNISGARQSFASKGL